MAVSDRQKRFFSQKPTNAIAFKTIEYYHPRFGSRFLLQSNGKVFFDKKLTIETEDPNNSGQTVTFKPTAMNVQDPKQKGSSDMTMSVSFPSIDAGTEIRNAIKSLTPWDWFEAPISQVYRIYRSDDTTSPLVVLRLFVNEEGITDNGASITIQSADDNPSDFRVSQTYTVARFPGLTNS